MKILTIAAILVTFVSLAKADEYVRGHETSRGTYVEPHYRSSPDNSTYNNYSTRGNTNPYTDKQGTVNPERVNNYGSSKGSLLNDN